MARIGLFSTLCDNFCLWNREMLTEKDFYDYFAEETISIGFVSTHKPEEPIVVSCLFYPHLPAPRSLLPAPCSCLGVSCLLT